jgi:hypothetical protein
MISTVQARGERAPALFSSRPRLLVCFLDVLAEKIDNFGRGL